MQLVKIVSNDKSMCTRNVLFKQIQIGSIPNYRPYALEDYTELVIIRDALINAKVGSRSKQVYKDTYVLDIYENINGLRSYIPLSSLVNDYISNKIGSIDIKLLERVANILLIELSDIK